MVGSRRDERFGAAIATTNIFCALESRRRHRKKPQEDGSVKKSDNNSNGSDNNHNSGAFSASAAWIPTPVAVSSWADCEDDDDDYFANAPLPSVLWGSEQRNDSFDGRDHNGLAHDEEEEEEEDDIDQEESEEDEDANNEAENESEMKETEAESVDPTSLNMQRNLAVQREPERQLSRKDQKKKEMAELDAVLAEFSLNHEDEKVLTPDSAGNKKESDSGNLSEDKESEPVQVESRRNAKRKKPKKGKSFKEERADSEVPNILNGDTEEDAERNSIAPVDPKEVMKKLALLKKKKSPKENDAAAKAAAAEAATRAAKLAAAKKKEKNHYNQRPPAR